jgi:putative transposase
MKARYQYRIYPTNQQKRLLSQLFGCVRVVWNDTLAYCQELYQQGEKKPKYTELSKRLTQIKKTTEKVWLTEVSSIPLQQSLRDLETAYSNFLASCKGERKGKKVKPPKFKKRKSKQSARFTDNGFTVNQHHVTLAKIGDLKVVWSRPLSVISYQLSVIRFEFSVSSYQLVVISYQLSGLSFPLVLSSGKFGAFFSLITGY